VGGFSICINSLIFSNPKFRFLHETGLALLFGLIMGAVVRYGVTDLGSGPKTMKVRPYRSFENPTSSKVSMPDILLLEARGKARENMLNKTLAYTFKGEVKDIDNINQVRSWNRFNKMVDYDNWNYLLTAYREDMIQSVKNFNSPTFIPNIIRSHAASLWLLYFPNYCIDCTLSSFRIILEGLQ